MAVFHTVWPGWPPYSYVAREYAHVGVPLHCVMPCFCNMVAGKPGPTEEIRRFYLERSVFDLVDYHKFLSLTDPKLLGWYLCLSQEDRTIIQAEGGFQHFLLRHPALELSRHHVYVKCHVSSVAPAQPTVMSNRPTHVSQWSGATKCGSDLERLPNNVRETLNQLGCCSSSSSGGGVDGSQKRPTAFNGFGPQEPHQQNVCTPGASSHLNEQRPSWPTSSKDSSALASFSLDVDLERHRRSELRSQAAMTQGQSPDCSWAEVSLIQSDWPTVERGSSPECYSFDSIQTEGAEHSDRSVLQPAEREPAKSTPDPVEENSPEEGLQDHVVCANECTEGEDDASVSFRDQSDNSHSIMENDGSILACLTSDYVKGLSSGVHSGPVHTDGEALAAADGETSKSDRSVAKVNAAGTCSSLMPRVAAALPPRTPAATQTERPGTADEHVNTEVRMVDLDYLAEEFIKLRTTRDKLRRQNEEMKSSSGSPRKECDCVQRAQRAELSLLALQHSVCRQYCWRLYYTSSEGATPKNPSANITDVLQQLECEYSRMRDEILAGVPLEQLKPLSVDCETIATRATCIPAKIISDVLGSVPSRVRLHSETSKKSKTTAERQEFNACEAWYDAEENLQHAGPAAARTGQEPAGTGRDEADESASEEAKTSVLCVSNLPGNVTESDVMLWFEKYHASEVSISALKNDLRVAIVTVSGPRAAEAAVRELRGCSMQGRALQVEHINGASGGSQRPASASIRGPESAEDSTGPPTCNTERKPISRPPLGSSMKTRKVVFISPTPTAKGTCVPRQYGTMGSFDALMAELSQRHPAVGRQRIVDALMELQVKHRGVLSGLPLRTIREMTSELLTRPGTGTATL